jgi:hypothetical protein
MFRRAFAIPAWDWPPAFAAVVAVLIAFGAYLTAAVRTDTIQDRLLELVVLVGYK